MNIREFAKLCGVSAASASRALNRPPEKAELSRALYDSIRAKAQEVGYRPNFYAQRMQSEYRDVIGFIVGKEALKLVIGELVDAVGSVLQRHQKSLTIFTCANVVDDIMPALEKMIQQGVDAIIIYFNTYQKETDIERVLKSIQERYIALPPIIALFCGFSPLKCFEVRFDEEAIGKRAAHRQLALGCKRFGVLCPLTTNPRNERIIQAYRNELKSKGVPDESIVRVDARHMASAEELQMLADVDGMWIGFLLSFPGLRDGLSQVCALEKLHVDAFCTEESTRMFEWFSPCLNGRDVHSRHPFQSLYVTLVSLQNAGACAAQLALEVASAKAILPFRRDIDCQYVDFNDKIKTSIFVRQ